jgi:hypothetical protein
MAAVPFSFTAVSSRRQFAEGVQEAAQDIATPNPLKPPKSGIITVAYPLSRGVVDIDFTGPWAIFGSVMPPSGDMTSPFHQYSVAETKASLVTASGLTVVPDYNFETAPQPEVIVVPAQNTSEFANHRPVPT